MAECTVVKYRKKPVVVEAIQFDGSEESFNKCRKFAGDNFYYDYQVSPTTRVKTLEGEVGCSVNDWIIKGVKGEFYPCKPDIFEATYEEVFFPKNR